MSKFAWAYVLGVLASGLAYLGMAIHAKSDVSDQWGAFFLLTALATASQFFKAEAPGLNVTYYATPIFFFAGVILLDPLLFIVLVTFPSIVEWFHYRVIQRGNSIHLGAWYIQPFNIAADIIAGLTAHWVYGLLYGLTASQDELALALSGMFAALTFVTLNHVLLGLALVLGRGKTWDDTGMLDVDTFTSDLILLLLGYVIAVLWQINPWLIIPALSPLVLMYRALRVPQLQEQAQTDPKTGLYNVRHFNARVAEEIERAQRQQRPLALIMADLDYLRTINNTYGHLAGDAVIAGIATIIRGQVRRNDLAARFGGEEYAIVLPDTSHGEAREIAERIRAAIAAMPFVVSTQPEPIRATMSLGIACFPEDAATFEALTHQADIAVYHAKADGRNQVRSVSDLPQAVRLAGIPAEAALPATAIASPPPAVSQPSAAAAPQPPMAATPQTTAPEPRRAMLPLLVAAVIGAGVLSSALGLSVAPQVSLATLMVLGSLAAAAELTRLDLYGRSSLSVSAAAIFGAALIAGTPGVIASSAAVAITSALAQRPRSSWYKTAFNWATHTLAGIVPALVFGALGQPLALESLPALMVALLVTAPVYFAIDTGLVAAAVACSTRSRILTTWLSEFRWLAAHYAALCAMGLLLAIASAELGWAGFVLFCLPVLMLRYAQSQYVRHTDKGVQALQRLDQELARANSEVGSANLAIRRLNEDLFLTVARIVDARDSYLASHSSRVAEYARRLAEAIGLAPDHVERVRLAALLHDIGKVAVTDQVLHKAGPLTDEEYRQIQRHPTVGADMLEGSQALRHLASAVRHHHERWDGTGYPARLRGEEIPLDARIIAVCDSVEAMESARPYRAPRSRQDIAAELRRVGGTQLDPQLVGTFLRLMEEPEHGRVMPARPEWRAFSEA